LSIDRHRHRRHLPFVEQKHFVLHPLGNLRIDRCIALLAGNCCCRVLHILAKVNVIIADTVRGKGLPSIEARADRWFCSFSAAEVDQLLHELHGRVKATIESETLVVR